MKNFSMHKKTTFAAMELWMDDNLSKLTGGLYLRLALYWTRKSIPMKGIHYPTTLHHLGKYAKYSLHKVIT